MTAAIAANWPAFLITAGGLLLLISATGLARRHHPRWHRAGHHVPAHAPGSERSPRAAAGLNVPGGGDAGDFPAGRAEQAAADEEWADTLHYWADEERGRSGMPLTAPVADTDILGVGPMRNMGMAGQLGAVQPWDTAPQPRCEALVPLPPDDRYMHPRPCPDAVPDPVVRGEAEISADETAEWAERWREAFEPEHPWCPECGERHGPGECEYVPMTREELETGDPFSGPGPCGWRELDEPPTVTDMRAVPDHVAARERAITTARNREHVQRTLTWQSGTRTWVLDVIGPDPAQDWEQLLAQARAGGSDE